MSAGRECGIIKAISLWQPWASLMAVGFKTIETRGWATRYRGPLAIHAAKRRMTVVERELIHNWRRLLGWGWPLEADLPYGAILAVVDLVDCARVEDVSPGRRDEAFGNYERGRWAWITRNLRPLAHPVPWRGAQGLFDVPASALSLESLPAGGGALRGGKA